MASGKKKLDEYHLKILRELVSLPSNKQCFDCHQRGPTYVNVTIGSFVCTTCSGMLRGLTPPHRVKSISMATFTPDEIDFVKARGNEYCRRVWLGLCDTDQPTKDEQQIKDFMINKYERKRYYLNPSTNPTANGSGSGSLSPNNTPAPSTPLSHVKPSTNTAVSTVTTTTVSNNSAQTSVPAIAHPATFQLKPPSVNNRSHSNSVSAQILAVNGTNSNNNNKNHNNNNVFTPDQLFPADFSNATTDPFSSSNSNAQFGTVPPQPNFANFENNPIFNSSSSGSGGSTEPWGSTSSHFSLPTSLTFDIPMRTLQHNIAPANRWSFAGVSSSDASEDRYAALKDLDCLMKSQQQQQQQQQLQQQSVVQTPTGLDWGTNGGVGMNLWPQTNIFNSTVQGGDTKTVTSNPFTGESIWSNSNAFSVNPFRNNARGVADGVWCGVPNGQLTNGFPTSHSLNFAPAKATWNSDPISNPFTVGSSSHTTGHHSSNPFL